MVKQNGQASDDNLWFLKEILIPAICGIIGSFIGMAIAKLIGIM